MYNTIQEKMLSKAVTISTPRCVDQILTPKFEEYCDRLMNDGGQTDQMQIRLLEQCTKPDRDSATSRVMVQDLMVFLVFKRGMSIRAVRWEIRSYDRGFALRVGAEAYRRRQAATQAAAGQKGVAA